MDWIPIYYRDFYDVPRAFVADDHGTSYFFDCPFDAVQDEYDRLFRVYQLSADDLPPRQGSWEGVAARGTLLGQIQVSDIVFDPTRRAAIDASVFRRIRGTGASSDG